MAIVLALLRAVFGASLAAFRPKASLVLENLTLPPHHHVRVALSIGRRPPWVTGATAVRTPR